MPVLATSKVLLLSVVSVLATSAIGQDGRAAVVGPYEEAIGEANTQVERLRVAQAALAEANLRRSHGEAHWESLKQFGSAMLLQDGRADLAVPQLQELIQQATSPFFACDARRMLSQAFRMQGRIQQAGTTAHEGYVAAIQSGDFPGKWLLAESCADGWIDCLQQSADYAGAIDARLGVVAELGDHLSAERQALYLVENARDAAKLGDGDGATVFWSEFFLRFPDYGRDNGKHVSLRLESMRVRFASKTPAEYAAALTGLWDRADIKAHPQAIVVAQTLGSVFENYLQDSAQALVVYAEARDLVNQNEPAWIAAGRLDASRWYPECHAAILSRLAIGAAHQGDQQLAEDAALDFLSRYGDHVVADDVEAILR